MWKNKYTISPNEYPIRFDSIVIHPSPSFINLSRLPFTKQRVASECRESHINSGELIDLWHAIRAGCGASEVKVTSDTLRRGKREGKKEVALLLLWHSGETAPGSAGTHSRCYLDVAPWESWALSRRTADTLISCYPGVAHRSGLLVLHSDQLAPSFADTLYKQVTELASTLVSWQPSPLNYPV